MRAGDIEGLHPADAAKQMLRDAGIEAVSGQRIRATEELEALRRHDQVQIAGEAADRAVAIQGDQRRGRPHCEANPAAMTTATMRGHASSLNALSIRRSGTNQIVATPT